MSWSYDLSQLTLPLNQVRFMIGDTNSADPLLSDQEVNLTIALRYDLYGAAADCCRALATQFSRKVDSSQGGGLHVSSSVRATAFARRAAEYEARASFESFAAPYMGGFSVSDMAARSGNTDAVPPMFNIGMEDNYLPIGPVGNE